MGSPRKPPRARHRRKLPSSPGRRPSWKLLGLAGVAGVAATGVVVARSRRAPSELSPDELRERLHDRLSVVGAQPVQQPPDPPA